MFTGIVEELGTVTDASDHSIRVAGGLVMDSIAVSDSIAVNGVCLTVVGCDEQGFTVELSVETLSRTNLGQLRRGDYVDLERALTPQTRMGGHIVQGHVDGTVAIVSLEGPAENRILTIRLPNRLLRYVVEKGFIALDGMSLTVASLDGVELGVAVIPYTEEHTVLKTRKPGDLMNIEVDILAKYVERLASPDITT